MSKVHIARQGYLTKSTLPNVTRTSDTAINSQLLLLGSGTNGSTTFTDSSVNNRTITAVGNAQISTAQFPTGMTSSMLFDGNVDRLSMTSFTLTGNFTCEAYVYLTAAQANWRMLCGQNFEGGVYWAITAAGMELQLNSPTQATCSNTFAQNTWIHIAVVRNSGVISYYVNGQSRTVTNPNQSNNFIIDSVGNAYLATLGFIGYISNFRITSTAVYTGNFTPLPLPLANTVPTVYASALLLGDGTDGSTSIVNSSIYTVPVTRIGTPTISTASFPTGMTSSINIPGTTSYLRMDHSALFNFAADFTIEMYVNYSAHAAFGGLFSAAGSMFPGWTGLQIVFNNTADTVTVQGNTNTLLTSSSALSRNVWNHVALSRVSGVMRLFFNGTEVASVNNSVSYSNNSAYVYVGSERSPGGTVTGYFSNVRVLNTLGLYSANFTPPALPLSNPATTTISNNTYGVYQNY